jgi:DNA-directed RNA polymerase subunit RPC12/RpoP
MLRLIVYIVKACVALWNLFQDRKNEARCPSCGSLWAAEGVGEQLMGIFSKDESSFFDLDGNSRIRVRYEKYKIHYRCKYCSHKWEFFKSRKL